MILQTSDDVVTKNFIFKCTELARSGKFAKFSQELIKAFTRFLRTTVEYIPFINPILFRHKN